MMRTFIFLLSTVVLGFNTTDSFSQEKIEIKKDKTVTVDEVFKMVTKQSGFSFIYPEELFKDTPKVKLKKGVIKLKKLLDYTLSSSNVNFRLSENNVIVINENSIDELIIPKQQTFQISGIVTDVNGQPLPGANILEKGTTNGVQTDFDGNFSITVANENAVLVISYVGFITQEVKTDNQTNVKISLAEDTAKLDEVVVVGYGTQKKINVTGSVSTVKGKKLQNIPTANVANNLIGQLPGLIAVNRSGEPGYDEASINIRGFSNMLVIVDGIPQSFSQLDPNEIDSISILKDASASIYGARAGNGVLLVTTKRGKIGKPKITFNANTGIQSPTRFPDYVDAPTYARMLNDAEVAVGRTPLYSDEEIEKFRNGTDPAYPNTDWYAEVFNKSAPMSSYNLNTSGGNDKVSYFFSLGYLNQDGLLKSGDTKYNRYNLRSNIDAKISKSFSVALDLSGRIEQRNYPGATTAEIMQSVFFSNPTYPSSFPDKTKPVNVGISTVQPVAFSNKDYSGYTDDNRKYFNGILTFKYDAPFLKGLSAKAVFNYGFNNNYSKDWRKLVTIYNYDTTNDVYTIASVGGKNQLDESLTRESGMTSQIYLSYNKEIGLHNISTMLIGEIITSDANFFSAHREGYISTAIDQLFAGADLNKNNNGWAYQDSRMGYAGRLNYSYAGKYLLEATLRRDASARYNAESRWGYFPGISLGWRISDEAFLKDVNLIDNLKLRISHGKAGNDYVGRFNYLTGYQFSSGNVFGETPVLNKGIISKGLANEDLTWEVTTTSNIGLDGALWKGRLNFEFDVFYRKVEDVPGYRYESLPSTFGATLPQENINSYDDRGFEIVLGHKNSIRDFLYNISGNVTYARSKWIHYDEPVYEDDETRERLQVSGQWRNRWFGYEALGLFQSQEEIDSHEVIQDGNNNQTLKPGDIKYADHNNDGVLDYKDSHVIGKGTTPEVIFGLNLGCQYKGFDLSMLWQGATNFNAYFSADAQVPFFNGATPLADMVDYWTPDNTGAKYPRMYPGGAANNNHVSSFWLQDATYIRLKNVQLGYTLPETLLSKLKMETVRVYLSGYNVFSIDNVTPYDPETGASRGWFYPQQKTYSIGVNITL